MLASLQGLTGIFAICLLAWAMSEDRRAVPWKTVAMGLLLQGVLALAAFRLPAFRDGFGLFNQALMALEQATQAGTGFVFGYLGGAEPPFVADGPGSGFVLAFRALPIILVISALSSLLFHWRILPVLVRAFGWVLRRLLGIGGALGLSVAANVFVGMVEGPLFVRPYIKQLDRGELFAMMAAGMAGIAGSVMVLYASVLGPVIPDALGHILIASVLSAPAAVVVSVLMVPPRTRTAGEVEPPEPGGSTMDAITRGTAAGLELMANIVALLIVLVSLVTLVNLMLGALPDLAGAPLSLQRLLGYLMAPLVWLAGIPWSEAVTAGALMGTKTILNELIAYVELAKLPPEALSPASRLIMLYALCGFANLGSLGILIGGMTAMCPERRGEILELGFRTIIAGTLATLLTGALVGVLAPAN